MRSMPCVRSWRSLDHLPFDEQLACLPFGIPSQKGGVLWGTLGYFGVLCRVFVFKGSLFVFGWSLWSFRLYLGASLCTYAFLAFTLFLMGYSC